MSLSGSALDWANQLRSCQDIKIALKVAHLGNHYFKYFNLTLTFLKINLEKEDLPIRASLEEDLQFALEIENRISQSIKMAEINERKIKVRIEKIQNKTKSKEDEIEVIIKDLDAKLIECSLQLQRIRMETDQKVQLEEDALKLEREKLKTDLDHLRKHPKYQTKERIEAIKVKLGNLEVKNIEPDLCNFNCSVCIERPKQCFICVQCQNWLCQDCKSQVVSCPQCRQDLGVKPLVRCKAVERIVLK